MSNELCLCGHRRNMHIQDFDICSRHSCDCKRFVPEKEEAPMKAPVWSPPKPRFICARDAHSMPPGEMICAAHFDQWYAEHIESLGPGIEMFGIERDDGSYVLNPERDYFIDKIKVFIVAVQPIKEPNAEDLLIRVLAEVSCVVSTTNNPTFLEARTYLEKKKRGGE